MEKRIYIASEGMTFRRKSDGHIMRSKIILGNFADGTPDVIENYEEVVDENPRQRRNQSRQMSYKERLIERRRKAKQY